MSYDDSVHFDNATWDEFQIMMYIKLHSSHFHFQVPPPFQSLMTVLWETSLGKVMLDR